MRALWLATVLASAPGGSGEPPDVPRIANGELATACQWPSVVVMRDESSGTGFCSGTLIHPEVVLFAAHCMDPDETEWEVGTVGFGENGWLPQFGIEVKRCEMHPGYDPTNQDLDLAVCRLAEPVEDVPIVPLLMGCEVEALAPGGTVTIVGFGATAGIYDGQGGVDISGQGQKRFAEMLFEGNDLLLLGDETGACFGDSGGPAFVQLPDGEWRVIGAASTVHPDTQYDKGDNVCTYGSVYELAFPEAAWLEDASGVDVTPCHDADGMWNPGPRCREFPFDPGAEGTSWSDDCAGGPTTDWVSTCGPSYADESEPGDSGTGGLDDSGLVGRGCSCTATGARPGRLAALLLLALLVVRPRREEST